MAYEFESETLTAPSGATYRVIIAIRRVPDVRLAWSQADTRVICWTCRWLTVPDYRCSFGGKPPISTRCQKWEREVGTDDEVLPRRGRWPIVGTAH